jgi:hypothetical protein
MPLEKPLFKTPELEKQYMEIYEAVLGLWKVPQEAPDVRTSFGTTHINVAGSIEKPAMLLFPAFGANSTMWFPNIAILLGGIASIEDIPDIITNKNSYTQKGVEDGNHNSIDRHKWRSILVSPESTLLPMSYADWPAIM